MSTIARNDLAPARPAEEQQPALRPLSDRILRRLGRPRSAWILAWAAIPGLNAAGNLALGEDRASPIWDQEPALIVLSYASVSFAIVMSLWGATRIARSLESLLATPSRSLQHRAQDLFRGMSSRIGPLVVSLVIASTFSANSLVQDGLAAALLRFATWFVVAVALSSYLWTYATLLLGLDRLGRERLVPDPVHVDPGLGLRPLGSIASSGLWMLLVWLVPVLVTALPDVVGAVAGFLLLAIVLTAFFLSLFRLHRQMVEVKADELAMARDLYAQAYEPVHRARTLEALEAQRALLSAADALERRASAIHEWPFTERTPTLVITIATSVTAMTIGRMILDPFGL